MKVKNINKSFKYFTIEYWKNRKRLKYILKCIKKAKNNYINEYYINFPVNSKGLCYYLSKEFNSSMMSYGELKKIIPVFTPEFFNIKNCNILCYWWDRHDKQSRINAFNKLIDYYTNIIKEL